RAHGAWPGAATPWGSSRIVPDSPDVLRRANGLWGEQRHRCDNRRSLLDSTGGGSTHVGRVDVDLPSAGVAVLPFLCDLLFGGRIHTAWRRVAKAPELPPDARSSGRQST